MDGIKITAQISVPKGAADRKDVELRKACKNFESIFTYHLLKSMRKTIEKCDLLHGGQGEDVYQSLFDMELSKQMADLSPGSLSRLLYNQLKKLSSG